jgi:predicted  nucleic acid-binding Zn-ribbon protein
MEKFGVHKRDLLKKRVVAARDEQQAASEQFKDALTRLREMYKIDGGDLEKTYDELKRDYDRSASRADAVRTRIRDVETVAGDLFTEWEKEIEDISTPSLRQNSKDKLRDTRQRYEEMITALKRAEGSMEPVLTRFKDQVLYLKHNLNAAAVASLKGESLNIQEEITKLLKEMNDAIAKADKFIQAMP